MARSPIRAVRKKHIAMRISDRIVRVLVAAAFGGLALAGPASAFDPAKVFADEKPSANSILRYFFDARKRGQEEEAVGALKYAADQGNHAAQWKLGRMYQTGDGVAKDPAAAFSMYKQIADGYAEARPGSPDWQFTADAMVALGRYYLAGVPEAGVRRNKDEALTLFTTAATYFGHSDAQFELARMYLDGENSQGDIIQAARMLKAAADGGHAGAEMLLGNLLFEGLHLRRDAVRGLTMMLSAQKRIGGPDRRWADPMVENAFALATNEERRAAMAAQAQASN